MLASSPLKWFQFPENDLGWHQVCGAKNPESSKKSQSLGKKNERNAALG